MSLSGRASSRTVEPKSASSTTPEAFAQHGLVLPQYGQRLAAAHRLLDHRFPRAFRLLPRATVAEPRSRTMPQRTRAGSKRSGGSLDSTPNSSTASPKEQVKSTSARS